MRLADGCACVLDDHGKVTRPCGEHGKASGLFCSRCGVEFTEAHGEPVLCPACSAECTNRPRYAQLPMAWHEVR